MSPSSATCGAPTAKPSRLPYRSHNHVIEGVIVTFVDITRMVEAEAQQRTLIEELNHRVRNMLTVVNAIAKQTLAQTRSPQEFAAALDGRIEAMAAAYSLVSRENWKEVPLREIITEQLKPHQLGPGDRLEISGPTCILSLPRPWRWALWCTSSRPMRPSTARSRGQRAGYSSAGPCGMSSCRVWSCNGKKSMARRPKSRPERVLEPLS